MQFNIYVEGKGYVSGYDDQPNVMAYDWTTDKAKAWPVSYDRAQRMRMAIMRNNPTMRVQIVQADSLPHQPYNSEFDPNWND
jgi:hypothetical protein